MRILKSLEILLLLLLISNLNSFSQNDKSKIVVAYINNFIKYTTWSNENAIDTFRIVIITEDKNIISEFKKFSNDRKLKGKPVKLSVYNSGEIKGNSQIIFIANKKLAFFEEIYDKIDEKPVLLVSESNDNQRMVMINLYKTKDDKLLFEVNKANILNQNLTIDPEILLAGGTEIDVATLYRNSQVNMREIEKSIHKIRDSLNILTTNIKESSVLIDVQKSELLNQNDLLNKKSKEIDSLQNIFSRQESYLKSQKASISQKNDILHEQLAKMTSQWKKLDKQEQLVKDKQGLINNLNIKIESKNIILGSQSELIIRQKRLIYSVVLFCILVIVLVITTFISYQNNKQKGKLLAKQKEDIEDKFEELEHLNKKLKQADQYKSIFLASMSHELRTPLNSIIGYTGILLMGMTGELNEEQNKQLSKVKNNANHLLSLINDILDISKIEANKVEINIEKFKLIDVIHEVIESLIPHAEEKNIKITSKINKYLVLKSDKRRIKQVVLNLLSNAVKYSDTGSIHIYTDYQSENIFRLTVKDTGVGISEEEMARLFQPFQQIDSTLTRKNSGTGLGLYLCRKLMSILGGDIYVNSIVGKGSEFYIEMPVNNKN